MDSKDISEVYFVDDGVKVAHFDLDRMKIKCFLPLAEASNRFWKLIDEELAKSSKSSCSLINSSGKAVVEVDGSSRRIIHEMWDPEASFILSELEQRGTDGCDCSSGAFA